MNIGQRRFDGCMEGDKERVLQLDSTKLKVSAYVLSGMRSGPLRSIGAF